MAKNLTAVKAHTRYIRAPGLAALGRAAAEYHRTSGAGPLNLFDYRAVKGGSLERMNGYDYAEDLRDMASQAGNMAYGRREAARLRKIADAVEMTLHSSARALGQDSDARRKVEKQAIIDAQREVGY